MLIRTNIAALSVTQQLGRTQGGLSSSLEKISSGLRINRAADDTAGLGVASRMESDNTSLRQAIRNTNDGISLVQTAEGSIEQLTNILIRVRELSVQAANETYASSDREMIGTEMTELMDEYNRITSTSSFNEQSLLDGCGCNGTSSISIQVGIDGLAVNRIDYVLSDYATSGGAIASLATVFTAIGNQTASTSVGVAQSNLDDIDNAITALSTRRASLGALQNRFENSLAEASTMSSNLSSSQSQIMDVDYASESANMTRFQIQQQAGVAALAQAKAMPQSIISLLN